MQTLIEFIIGLVAAIAATALAQFGVDVNSPRQTEREVRRIAGTGDVCRRQVALPQLLNPRDRFENPASCAHGVFA